MTDLDREVAASRAVQPGLPEQDAKACLLAVRLLDPRWVRLPSGRCWHRIGVIRAGVVVTACGRRSPVGETLARERVPSGGTPCGHCAPKGGRR